LCGRAANKQYHTSWIIQYYYVYRVDFSFRRLYVLPLGRRFGRSMRSALATGFRFFIAYLMRLSRFST
jgi:hypothetical protein